MAKSNLEGLALICLQSQSAVLREQLLMGISLEKALKYAEIENAKRYKKYWYTEIQGGRWKEGQTEGERTDRKKQRRSRTEI